MWFINTTDHRATLTLSRPVTFYQPLAGGSATQVKDADPAAAGRLDPAHCIKLRRVSLADGVGFEPTVGVNPRRFSRPLP